EIPERAARARRAPLARRARPKNLSKRVGAGVEIVGRPDEDDPERVPPDALAEGSAGIDREAHGRLLLRGGRRTAAGVRSATIEIASRATRSRFRVLRSGFVFRFSGSVPRAPS